MSANLSDLRDVTRDEIKVDPKGLIWGNTVLDRYILIAHRKLQKDLDFGFPGNENGTATIATTGVLEYTLPTDLARIGGDEGLVKIGNSTLESTEKNFLLQFSELNTGGTPGRYYITGNVIGFDLIPNGINVDLFYLKFATAPTESTASGLPDNDEINQAIGLYAKYLAWKSPKGNNDTAREALEEYEHFLEEIRHEIWTREVRSFRLLRRRRFTHHTLDSHNHLHIP